MHVSRPDAAEMTKLLENTFRAVNIALANEFARSAGTGRRDDRGHRRGEHQPYGFMPFIPGPGVGGHCIPCDPHYLLWQLTQSRVGLPVVEQAMTSIAQRPRQVVRRVRELLSDSGRSIGDAHVLVVGCAYKPGVADYRESPALEVLEELEHLGARVSYYDPRVPELRTMTAGAGGAWTIPHRRGRTSSSCTPCTPTPTTTGSSSTPWCSTRPSGSPAPRTGPSSDRLDPSQGTDSTCRTYRRTPPGVDREHGGSRCIVASLLGITLLGPVASPASGKEGAPAPRSRPEPRVDQLTEADAKKLENQKLKDPGSLRTSDVTATAEAPVDPIDQRILVIGTNGDPNPDGVHTVPTTTSWDWTLSTLTNALDYVGMPYDTYRSATGDLCRNGTWKLDWNVSGTTSTCTSGVVVPWGTKTAERRTC